MTPHPYAELLRAIANGHTEFELADEHGNYIHDRPADQLLTYIGNGTAALPELYRIKPLTITINGKKVPKPATTPPNPGTCFWIPDLVIGASLYYWPDPSDEQDFEYHCKLLDGGLVHLSRQAAETHSEALLSITRTSTTTHNLP